MSSSPFRMHHRFVSGDEDNKKAIEGVRGGQILALFALGGDTAAIEEVLNMGVDVNTKDVSLS